MLIIRHAAERGRSETNWLKSFHTFSFADYYDHNWMGFGHLRVINEDYIAPNQGFNLHPHQNMEIITYVVRGALQHKDNMGNGSIIKPGEIQRMSAGTGVQHSEFNHLADASLQLLQIWILPDRQGLKPGYEQKQIQWTPNQLSLIGSDKPTATAVTIHQKVNLYVGHFHKDREFSYQLNNHLAWLQLIKGRLRINECELHAGDGLGIQDEDWPSFRCLDEAEFLFFDLYTSSDHKLRF